MEENKKVASKEAIDNLDELTSIKVEIARLVTRVEIMNSKVRTREKSLTITALEEAGHWINDDINKTHKLS